MSSEITSVDFETLEHRNAYKLMTSLIVPRPIAWVTTRGKNGQPNAAPFSFFNAVGATPPTIVLGLGLREGTLKDTTRNLIETGEFVAHTVTESLIEAMNITAVEATAEICEPELAGLELVDSVKVQAPRIAAALAAFECRVWQIIDIGEGQRLVIARIVEAHIRQDLFEDREKFHIATERLHMVGRMNGAGGYTRAEAGRFEMPRLPWPMKK